MGILILTWAILTLDKQVIRYLQKKFRGSSECNPVTLFLGQLISMVP